MLENRALDIVATNFKVTQHNPQVRARPVDVLAVDEGKSDAKLVVASCEQEFEPEVRREIGAERATSLAALHAPVQIDK